MGEYARIPGSGESVKIGTCEDMLYLRRDQFVWPEAGSLNPNDPSTRETIRFRFPWPDEDGSRPGSYEDPFRALWLSVDPPEEVDHYSVQFKANQGEGLLVSLPCQFSDEGKAFPYAVHRNGYRGSCALVQQAWRGGKWVAVMRCVCGALYRLPELADAAPVVEAVLAIADRHKRDAERYETDGDLVIAQRYTEIARRLVDGYSDTLAVPDRFARLTR